MFPLSCPRSLRRWMNSKTRNERKLRRTRPNGEGGARNSSWKAHKMARWHHHRKPRVHGALGSDCLCSFGGVRGLCLIRRFLAALRNVPDLYRAFNSRSLAGTENPIKESALDRIRDEWSASCGSGSHRVFRGRSLPSYEPNKVHHSRWLSGLRLHTPWNCDRSTGGGWPLGSHLSHPERRILLDASAGDRRV